MSICKSAPKSKESLRNSTILKSFTAFLEFSSYNASWVYPLIIKTSAPCAMQAKGLQAFEGIYCFMVRYEETANNWDAACKDRKIVSYHSTFWTEERLTIPSIGAAVICQPQNFRQYTMVYTDKQSVQGREGKSSNPKTGICVSMLTAKQVTEDT